MFSKLKKFKDMKSQAKHMESELGQIKSEGSAVWGKIKMVVDGNRNIQSVSIDDELLKPSEKMKLQEGLIEAHKDALKKMQFALAKKLQEMGGLDALKNMGG
ncbi:YbaB/EbfC family nucleoid-associated protein [Candidatus Uhrbacteria bacterium]|nr:YbaB/EbfC family nucleoid-associated protein [Candidatus Uhrbacteria bacterium]